MGTLSLVHSNWIVGAQHVGRPPKLPFEGKLDRRANFRRDHHHLRGCFRLAAFWTDELLSVEVFFRQTWNLH